MLPDQRPEIGVDRLDSWKDIAAYLRRDVSTVQRWEKREGLPVHRHLHDKQGSVYAFKSELDTWQHGRKPLDDMCSVDPLESVPRRTGLRSIVAIVAAGVLMLTVAGAVVLWDRPSADREALVVRSVVPLPPEALGAFVMAFSPDGTQLVYVGIPRGAPGPSRLYVKSTSELASRPIPGTENGSGPFFSPDGRWVGFFADGSLKRVAISGGAPVTLAAALNPRGGTWGPDDTIVFAPGYFGGLMRVSAAGGDPVPLTFPDRARMERSHRSPHFLPNGRAVLFVVHRANQETFDDADIEAVDLASGSRTLVVSGGMMPRYTTSGYLLYGRHGDLFAAQFDMSRFRVMSTPVPVVSGVLNAPNIGAMGFGISTDGTLVYAPGGSTQLRRLLWVDRSGRSWPVVEGRRAFNGPRISPDGRAIAVTIDAGVPRVWLFDVARGTFSPRTRGWDAELPIWAPDSQRIGFLGTRFGARGERLDALYAMQYDGREEPLPLRPEEGVPLDWSPDGSLVVVRSVAPETFGNLLLLSLREPTTSRAFVDGPAAFAARFSPDGRWVAYFANEGGRNEVYVKEIAPPQRRWQVSTNGGVYPVWARDGAELFYRQGLDVYVVKISPGPDFVSSRPEALFEAPVARGGEQGFDIGPDGRFVMVSGASDTEWATELVLVQNWFEELQRKVPAQ